MEKVSIIRGIAAPLKRSNVDTDQIIPAAYLKSIARTGFEDALFANWRHDPDFVLNRADFRSASVLVTGNDFGTGSSREHAVWALRDYGFRAVLSPRFADIFRGNAGKQGLVAAQVSEADLKDLWAVIDAQPGIEITVDLVTTTASLEGLTVNFEIDDYTRWRLLEGLDDIDLTLRNTAQISAFEARRESWRPTTTQVK